MYQKILKLETVEVSLRLAVGFSGSLEDNGSFLNITGNFFWSPKVPRINYSIVWESGMDSVVRISRSLIPRKLRTKHSHFNRLEDIFKFIYFSQKQPRLGLGRTASGLCYTLQQCETLHKLSMAFEIQASNSTCIILECFSLVFLAACLPAECGRAHL